MHRSWTWFRILLSISKLDCESIGLMYGFDYNCRGNHNQILADAMGVPAAFEAIAKRPWFALDEL
jgi:hypothetical protein